MAANYWESTQRKHWQFTKDQLAKIRQDLEDEDPGLVQSFPLPELRHLNHYFGQQILRLGKRLGVRQQAIATAQIYVKRFYTKIEVRRTNPYMLFATAIYLACKMEETPQHIRLVGQEARSLWSQEIKINNPTEATAKMGECEFFLISEMSSHLIVHHPYRSLTALQDTFNLLPDEFTLAWGIINDHYQTDLPLLYPPYVIALTAILLAIVLRPINNSSQGQNSQQQQQNNETGSAASRIASMQPSSLAAAQASFAQLRAGVLSSGQNTTSSNNNNNSSPSTPILTPQHSGVLGAALGGDNSGIGGGSEAGSIGGGGGGGSGKKAPDPRFAKVQLFAAWLAESNADVEAMIDCTQEMISLYEALETYNDKNTRDAITRFIKARALF